MFVLINENKKKNIKKSRNKYSKRRKRYNRKKLKGGANNNTVSVNLRNLEKLMQKKNFYGSNQII